MDGIACLLPKMTVDVDIWIAVTWQRDNG